MAAVVANAVDVAVVVALVVAVAVVVMVVVAVEVVVVVVVVVMAVVVVVVVVRVVVVVMVMVAVMVVVVACVQTKKKTKFSLSWLASVLPQLQLVFSVCSSFKVPVDGSWRRRRPFAEPATPKITIYDVMEGVTLVLDCHDRLMRRMYVPRGYINWSFMLWMT